MLFCKAEQDFPPSRSHKLCIPTKSAECEYWPHHSHGLSQVEPLQKARTINHLPRESVLMCVSFVS